MRYATRWMAPVVVLAAANFSSGVRGEQPDARSADSSAALTPVTTAETHPAPAAPVRLRHGVFKYSSYPVAWTSAQTTNKPILVFATSTYCPHCVRMVGETFQAPQVTRFVNDSFETVYVSRSEQPDMATKLKIRFFPTTIVVGPNNQVLDVIEGYIEPKAFAQRLQASVAAHQATLKR